MAFQTFYVYTLAYPDGRIFYVGKGQGDRMFQHEKEARYSSSPPQEEQTKIGVIRKIWASGGKVVRTKIFETEDEEEAYKYERHIIAQCDPSILTNRTRGGGPQFSKQDPYARIKHRGLYYSPKEAFEKLHISQEVWHRLFLAGVLHFYQTEGCTLPVLQRSEIDDFAARIQNGTYPIDAWEIAAPHVWKTTRPEKKSLWWDDDAWPQQEGGQYPKSRVEMQREAIAVAMNTAQHTFSEPCHLVGSYERQQPESDETAWDIVIRMGERQYTYVISLQQNHLIVSHAPLDPPIQQEKQEETPERSEYTNPDNDETLPSIHQTALGKTDIAAVTQPEGQSVKKRREPKLTITQVKARWEYVLRRIKTRKDGAKIAALLRGYTIVDVDESGDLPLIILKAGSHFHYHTVQKWGYQTIIEWAFKIEVDQECQTRLLSSEASSSDCSR